MKNDTIGILGDSAQADEAQSYLNDGVVLFRAVDPEYISADYQVNINDPPERYRQIKIVAAVGSPALRKKLTEKWPGNTYASVIAEQAHIDKTAKISQGVIIGPNAVITTNVNIGKHVIINIGATISHDTTIGDYATISPGVHIAGNVTIGAGVFIGIGAIISNNISIADGCVIGAGAVVVNDIAEDNTVAVGVPAKAIKQNAGWLDDV